MSVYGSDPFAYSFDAALARRTRGEPYWRWLADDGGFRETTYGLGVPTRTKPAGRVVPFAAPTAAQLAKHADKFARQRTSVARREHREQVERVAGMYGSDVLEPAKLVETVKRRASRRRPATPHAGRAQRARMKEKSGR